MATQGKTSRKAGKKKGKAKYILFAVELVVILVMIAVLYWVMNQESEGPKVTVLDREQLAIPEEVKKEEQEGGTMHGYMNIALFGKPKQTVYYPNMYPGQADTSGVLVLQYDGFVSSNVGAKDTWGVNFLQIEGEGGYLYVKDGTSGLTEITLVTREGETVLNRQEPVSRWLYEVQEITRLVHAGDLAECYRRLDVMLDVVEILEKARKDAGILFPCDEL